MSYGTHYLDGHRRLGIYTAKILNGAKPADLPVEQSTKFELVINLQNREVAGPRSAGVTARAAPTR